MAIVNSDKIVTVSNSNDSLGTPLLMPEEEEDVFVPGAVDYKNRSAIRSKHGRWRSASYIIWVEIAERMAYFGISGNLINFLTGRLGQSMAVAAANVNTWGGVSAIFPILGAAVADSFLGKYNLLLHPSFISCLGGIKMFFESEQGFFVPIVSLYRDFTTWTACIT